MENKIYPSWKHGLMYGVYLSIVLIILSLIYYVLDLTTQTWVGIISYAVLLAGIVISSVNYRNKHLGGYITYGQSLSIGFYTGLFAAIILAIFTVIFISILGDSYIQMILDATEEKMLRKRPDMTDEELDMAMNMTKHMMTPVWMSVWAFFGNLVFSVIFALIASIFIKKEDKSVQPEA